MCVCACVNLGICNIRGPRGHYAKGNKSDRKTNYCMISYMESKTQNKENSLRETHRNRERVGGCGKEEDWRGETLRGQTSGYQ